MNRMLVVIFDNEMAAEAGTTALRLLHGEGVITLYAMDVISKDEHGKVHIKVASDQGPLGTGVGMAVGGLIGLLGGPVGLAVGAVTGSVIGAIRDFWVAGVGVDFIEAADQYLKPGKVALIAEVEEQWIMPVDARMQAAGGKVFRRARADMDDAQFDHDMHAFKSEITTLEHEAKHLTGKAQAQLLDQLETAKTSLANSLHHAQQKIADLKQEASQKLMTITEQLSKSQGEAKAELEVRKEQVSKAYDIRRAKLEKAWGLTKEVFTV